MQNNFHTKLLHLTFRKKKLLRSLNKEIVSGIITTAMCTFYMHLINHLILSATEVLISNAGSAVFCYGVCERRRTVFPPVSGEDIQ